MEECVYLAGGFMGNETWVWSLECGTVIEEPWVPEMVVPTGAFAPSQYSSSIIYSS
jgi:hypothetical protein